MTDEDEAWHSANQGHQPIEKRFMPQARGEKPTTKPTADRKQLDARARWILDRWESHPSLRYGQMVEEARKGLGVGKTAAEQAIKRAYEILHDEWKTGPSIVDRLAARYQQIADKAEKAGDFRAAVRAMDSLRRHLGLGAPDRVEHTTKEATHDLSDMNEEDLLKIYLDADARRKK